ncbi:MAG TPA: hypothetical protein VIX19_08595 [Terriglobales bacterium]
MTFTSRICRWRVALHRIPVALLLLLLTSPLPAQPAGAADFPTTTDPKEIVRRSVEIDRRTADLARNYTYQQREVRKHLDHHGEVKSTVIETWDVTNLYGEPYSRLIHRDDKPLGASDEVWLMRRFYVDATARVLVVSNRAVQLEDSFSNYKRFATTTKILPGVREVDPK